MRKHWAICAAVLAALGTVGACRFSPATPCANDSDCGAGGRCNQATGSCYDTACDPACEAGTSCVAGVCLVGPTFTVTAAAPPSRPVPDLAGDGWHRDEAVGITVSSMGDVQGDTVRVEISGLLADGGTSAWVDAGTVAQAPCIDGVSSYCGSATVSLWLPEFEAYDGEVRVRAVGLGSNDAPGEGSVGVAITRQKWVVTVGSAIHASPAIGAGGVVFVATTGASGAVAAVNPDGTVKWQKSGFGSVEASPAVGAAAGEGEMLYVAGADAGVNAFVYALHAVDGGEAYKFGVDTTTSLDGPFLAAVGVGASVPTGTTTAFETATSIAVTTVNRAVSVRPNAATLQKSFFDDLLAPIAPRSSVAISDSQLFYGDTNANLRAISYVGSSWVPWIDWNAEGARNIGVSSNVTGPAIAGTDLIAGVQSRGAVAVTLSDATLGSNFPDGGLTAPPGIPSVSSAATFLGVTRASGTTLLKGSTVAPGSVSASASTADQVTAAPVLGDHDQLYTVTIGGVVQAWKQADLALRWSHSLGSGVVASPNLGCGASAGAPGILYAATEAGTLVAIVSDSHGLDPAAPWPKYQHDPRNTGNPATSLACP